jgi:hypothetical protein
MESVWISLVTRLAVRLSFVFAYWQALPKMSVFETVSAADSVTIGALLATRGPAEAELTTS